MSPVSPYPWSRTTAGPVPPTRTYRVVPFVAIRCVWNPAGNGRTWAEAVWPPERRAAVSSILLKLAAMGVRIPAGAGEEDVLHLAGDLFARYREQTRLLSEHLCPADQRIQRYIDGLLVSAALAGPIRLP